jgi:hypothetical protein
MKMINRYLMTTVVAVAGLTGLSQADDDEGRSFLPWGSNALPGVALVNNPLYQNECGSCHMAYQPGLLPAQSWEKLMYGLEDHFGENAALPDSERNAVLGYLLNNAAGRSNYRVSNKLVRNMREAPLRISELPYFVHEHREIPDRLVRGNPKVGSFSNCDSCHTGAQRGSYDEHQVNIPGYGRYDD